MVPQIWPAKVILFSLKMTTVHQFIVRYKLISTDMKNII